MRGLLSPFVALLFNKSLLTGCFLPAFKLAVIRPLLKKSGLDPSQLKNYRPVSNLSFLSKLLERVVRVRLQDFTDSNNLVPTAQSEYRQYYSTETEWSRCRTPVVPLLPPRQVFICYNYWAMDVIYDFYYIHGPTEDQK